MIGAYDKQIHDILCRKRLKVQCVKKGIRNRNIRIKVLILEQHFLEQKVPNRGPLRTDGGGGHMAENFLVVGPQTNSSFCVFS